MLKTTIFAATLLCSSSAFAEPVALTAPQMDRVSAGAVFQFNSVTQVKIARAFGVGQVVRATNTNTTVQIN